MHCLLTGEQSGGESSLKMPVWMREEAEKLGAGFQLFHVLLSGNKGWLFSGPGQIHWINYKFQEYGVNKLVFKYFFYFASFNSIA